MADNSGRPILLGGGIGFVALLGVAWMFTASTGENAELNAVEYAEALNAGIIDADPYTEDRRLSEEERAALKEAAEASDAEGGDADADLDREKETGGVEVAEADTAEPTPPADEEPEAAPEGGEGEEDARTDAAEREQQERANRAEGEVEVAEGTAEQGTDEAPQTAGAEESDEREVAETKADEPAPEEGGEAPAGEAPAEERQVADAEPAPAQPAAEEAEADAPGEAATAEAEPPAEEEPAQERQVAQAETGGEAAAGAAAAAAADQGGDDDAMRTAAVAGDPEAGAKVFRKCRACHVVDKEQDRVGPHLKGVVGRKPGAVEGYSYSDAMMAYGEEHVWDAETLAAYLEAPKKVVEGTKMQFAGLRKAEDRENVIAYLAENE